MEGFRYYYEQALRAEDSVDWAAHSLDYGLFKKRLMYFRKRRSTIKSFLRNSPDSTIPDATLAAIIGPQVHRPPPPPGADEKTSSNYGVYIPFVDDDYSSSSSYVPPEIFVANSSKRPSKTHHKRAILRRISNTERNEVTLFLTIEMDKVAKFYMDQWNCLSQILIDTGPSIQLGNEILELLAHCTINLMALRQSLIRYDAFVRTYGGLPMLSWYMKKMRKHQNSFRKILFHEELNALKDTLMKESLFDTSDFQNQWKMLEEVNAATQKAEALASRGQVMLIDSFIHTLRHYLLLGAIEDRMLSLEPIFLTERGTSLTAEMQIVSDWRKNWHRPPVPESTHIFSVYQYFLLSLNIISAFFYCMNYYIVEPSSTMYVNALGAPDYISGMLIGMMPIAAMLSAVGYAVWTNYSFRFPIIVSAMLMLSGNIVYASALKYDSVWIALIGRFMTGLGAPKCIIRRYMADTTPIAMRTSVNAAFALAIAVGSALGPAMAIFLNRFNFIGWVPGYGMFLVNGMTGPGYFMACIWAAYLIIIVLTFSEPDRTGLAEQIQLEQKQFEQEESIPTSQPLETSKQHDDDLNTIFSGETDGAMADTIRSTPPPLEQTVWAAWNRFKAFLELITPPVRLCLGLLFCKTFTIESLVSCTSALTKNRYGWAINQVGILGCINGLLVIPLSIGVGYLSMYYQDRVLMTWLVAVGAIGMFLLIDVTDLRATPTSTYNEGLPLAVDPTRYVSGYFLTYISIQSFEGVIGSALSKVIPTALASGTFNSGLLATLVDTLGRACGDLFISLMGWVSLRQLLNLLFIPAFCILMGCLITIRWYYDLLAV